MDTFFYWLAVLLLSGGAYAMGSVSTAILVCRLLGKPDPRQAGSGNPGATNVIRVAGKLPGAITFAGDTLKGVVAIVIGQAFGVEGMGLGLIGVAAVIGHLFPLFFRFQGGKGVATALGVITFLHWPTGLALMAIWLATFYWARISSAAGIAVFIVCPVLIYWFEPVYLLPAGLMSLLILGRHYRNIRSLIKGTEHRFPPPVNPGPEATEDALEPPDR